MCTRCCFFLEFGKPPILNITELFYMSFVESPARARFFLTTIRSPIKTVRFSYSETVQRLQSATDTTQVAPAPIWRIYEHADYDNPIYKHKCVPRWYLHTITTNKKSNDRTCTSFILLQSVRVCVPLWIRVRKRVRLGPGRNPPEYYQHRRISNRVNYNFYTYCSFVSI